MILTLWIITRKNVLSSFCQLRSTYPIFAAGSSFPLSTPIAAVIPLKVDPGTHVFRISASGSSLILPGTNLTSDTVP